MPQWNRTIDLKPAIARHKAGEGVPRAAEKAVEIIENSGWLDDTPYPDTLRDHLAELKQAEEEYDYLLAFDKIYDVADQDRVWIETK